jgi:hypothetical protein
VKLQRSSDLAAWTDVTSRVLAAASSELVDASPISSGRFYRVVPGAP